MNSQFRTTKDFRVYQNDDAKQRKIATEYVALCGFKHGEIGRGRKTSDNQNSMLTQSEIASFVKLLLIFPILIDMALLCAII